METDDDDRLFLLVFYAHRGNGFPCPPHPSSRLFVRADFNDTPVTSRSVPWQSEKPVFELELIWRMKQSVLINYLNLEKTTGTALNVKVQVLSSPSEPNAAPDLIGETEIPLSEVAPTTILIDSLDDSRRYSCTWMPLRSPLGDSVAPQVKMSLTYEPDNLDASTVGTDDMSIVTGAENTMDSRDRSKSYARLVPTLNKKKGYFVLSKEERADDHMAEFTLQLIFGKNLEKVAPREFLERGDCKFQMSYDFLDCEINTTQFKNLSNPETAASTATARIRASKNDFIDFATMMQAIGVKLVCGKAVLAYARIDPAKEFDLGDDDAEALLTSGSGPNEITRDGIALFRPFSNKTEGESAKKRRTELSFIDDPVLGYSITLRSCGLAEQPMVEKDATSSSKPPSVSKPAFLAEALDKLSEGCMSAQESDVYKAKLQDTVAELEAWKLRQQHKFQQGLVRLESQHQSVLSAEFRRREESRERSFVKKMEEVTSLRDELQSSMAQLQERERKLKEREASLLSRERSMGERFENLQRQAKLSKDGARQRAEAAESEVASLKETLSRAESSASEKARAASDKYKTENELLKRNAEHYKQALEKASDELNKMKADQQQQMSDQLKEAQSEVKKLRTELDEARKVSVRPTMGRMSSASAGGDEELGRRSSDLTASRCSILQEIARLGKQRKDLLAMSCYTDADPIIQVIDTTLRKNEGRLKEITKEMGQGGKK